MDEIDQKVAWQALCHLFGVRLDIILVVITNPLLCPLPLCVRPVVSTTLVCSSRYLHALLCLFCMSFVCLSIPLYYVLLPCFPCSLHTNNSATTQTPILRLNRKLTAAAIRMPRCQGHDPSFVFWDIQLQKNMFELEKIVPTATQEKNPFSGGNLVPFECSFRPGQALRE